MCSLLHNIAVMDNPCMFGLLDVCKSCILACSILMQRNDDFHLEFVIHQMMFAVVTTLKLMLLHSEWNLKCKSMKTLA